MDIVERYRSIATALAGPIGSGDAAELERAYSAFKEGPETAWIDTEREINDLGYETMGQRNLAVAERLFRLNSSSYPRSANAHDSLGEVYLAEGRLDLAREEYRRTVALSPGNENAVRVLREIDARERESGKKE
jgi:Tfp pilus assembly protein PilF